MEEFMESLLLLALFPCKLNLDLVLIGEYVAMCWNPQRSFSRNTNGE